MVDQTEEEKTAAQKATAAGLTFEEAPEVAAPTPPVSPTNTDAAIKTPVEPHHLLDVPQPVVKKPRKNRWIGNGIFVLLLFGLGIWLSSQLRFFISPETSLENNTDVSSPNSFVTPTLDDSKLSATTSGSLSEWKTVSVSALGSVLQSVTYQLPEAVLLPTCDGSGCPSSGTNLSNGTRFTVAARGKGERLPDFRGAILTDVNGKEFTMHQVRVGGKDVYEYVGDFTGRTGGGYQFTRMRGVLVSVSDTESVEFNHFSPVGIITDFAADDVIFNQIIESVKVPVTTTLSPTIRPTTSATSSGN